MSVERNDQKDPLVGVWRIQNAFVSSELVIQTGGRYTKIDRQGMQQHMISGMITVSQHPPTLRLNIQDYEPKQFFGPLGPTTIQMIAAETYRFEVNHDVLLLWDQYGGPYQYQRIV